MPLGQLLGRSREAIEALMGSREGSADDGWVAYGESWALLYESGCAVELRAHVQAGLEHRVARRRGRGGAEVLFLVPLAPSGTRYVGRICSAPAPDPSQCAGRCADPCPAEDLGRSFAP